jgi:hypothetical protein
MVLSRLSWCSSSSARKPSNIGMYGEATCSVLAGLPSPIASSRERLSPITLSWLNASRCRANAAQERLARYARDVLDPFWSSFLRLLPRCCSLPFIVHQSRAGTSSTCSSHLSSLISVNLGTAHPVIFALVMALSSFFSSSRAVFSAAIVLRTVFLAYGSFQDAYSPVKYTDIDYMVFTDSARFLSSGKSPYVRDTYRYTPFLAWLIYPTTWSGIWFSFGKVLFAIGDIITGWMMLRILRSYQSMPKEKALKYASIWLLNPMVATISTRGSSEGVLAVFVTALLWAVLAKRIVFAGFLLGFAVHFKIYPFIYAASILWWLDGNNMLGGRESKPVASDSFIAYILGFLTPQRLTLAVSSLVTFMGLNGIMYFA